MSGPYTFLQALTARDPETIRQQMLSDASTSGADPAGFDAMAVATALFSLDARAQSSAEALRVQLVNAGFAHLASESGPDWLDACLFGAYQEKRLPGTSAVWDWTVTCGASAGPYTIEPMSGELIALADDGTLFASANPTAVTIPSGGSAPLRFACRSAGIVGNQISGAVTRFVARKPGLRITNVGGTLVTAGTDPESDALYLARCFGKWGALGAGWTAAAFDYLIPLFAPTVTRHYVRDDNPFGPGTTGLWLANAAGPSTTDEVSAVQTGLDARDRHPLGSSTLKVIAAPAHTVAITGTLWSDGTNATLLGSATAALAALASKFPLGGMLPQELVEGVLLGGAFSEYGLLGFSGAVDVDLTAPAADVIMLPAEVLQFDVSGLVVTVGAGGT